MVHTFFASRAAFASSSVWVTPTRTSSPWPPAGGVIRPTSSPSTRTDADVTRCTRARTHTILRVVAGGFGSGILAGRAVRQGPHLAW